jgi:hypothetical protein
VKVDQYFYFQGKIITNVFAKTMEKNGKANNMKQASIVRILS